MPPTHTTRRDGALSPDRGASGPLTLRIEPSQHVFICGQTGSGKTYLSRLLLHGVKAQKLLIDVKGRFDFPGATLVEKVSELEKQFKRGGTILFRPGLGDFDAVDAAFGLAFRRGATTIYNDERGGWGRPWDLDLLPMEAHAVMRGRDRDCSVWTGTQRPARIPLPLKSEADHFFVFRLQNGDDRKSISEYAGDVIRGPLIPKRWFWYAGPDNDAGLHAPIEVVRKVAKRGVA